MRIDGIGWTDPAGCSAVMRAALATAMSSWFGALMGYLPLRIPGTSIDRRSVE
jgi:hypothetical protein